VGDKYDIMSTHEPKPVFQNL